MLTTELTTAVEEAIDHTIGLRRVMEDLAVICANQLADGRGITRLRAVVELTEQVDAIDSKLRYLLKN